MWVRGDLVCRGLEFLHGDRLSSKVMLAVAQELQATICHIQMADWLTLIDLHERCPDGGLLHVAIERPLWCGERVCVLAARASEDVFPDARQLTTKLPYNFSHFALRAIRLYLARFVTTFRSRRHVGQGFMWMSEKAKAASDLSGAAFELTANCQRVIQIR